MLELARLPDTMRDAGGQVVVSLPLEDQSVAHRVRWDHVEDRNARGSTIAGHAPRPKCQARPDSRVTWTAVSAAWADDLGAHACPAPACFGQAAP